MNSQTSSPRPGVVPTPFFLGGPTGVGKSAIALELARRLGGEIISVDSMQVYRGMDIGTAKPTPAERAEIPHHLLDVVDVTAAFDAAAFARLAKAAAEGVQARGRVPIFCGGTGLYFQAYLGGLGEAPASDPALREELERSSLPELLEELRRSDPATFDRVDRRNPRRIIRALEVIRLTGKPFSEQRAPWGGSGQSAAERGDENPCFIALEREKADLRNRINDRVDTMFRLGLVAEVERLLSLGLAENRTALQALGYRQVFEHLRGEVSLSATIEMVKVKTWQFARRQMTWFRRQARPVWVRISDRESLESVIKELEMRYLRVTGRSS